MASSVSSDDAVHEYLESLLANVAFNAELCGLALHSNAPPFEMHYPRLRRSESKQQAIDHLDMVSCWKGISNAQALEITLWERLFQRCLASQVEDDLRCRAIVQLSKVRDGVKDDELLPFLLQSLHSEQSRLVEVNLPNLIHDMIDAFYDDHPIQTAARNFRWSLGSGDLPGFVYNYIATQDCFLRSSEGMYLSAEVTLDCYTMPVVSVVARLRWQPPDIKFRPSPSQLGPRDQYIIAPYRVPDSSSYNRFSENVDYTVTRSTSMVQWDSLREAFRAQAPDTMTTSETLVQASMVTQFPNNVRFERTSRYIVKVEVVDRLQVDAMPDKYRQQAADVSMLPMPPYTNKLYSKTRSSLSMRQHRDLNPGFFEASRKRHSDSPKKRKASLHSASNHAMSPVELMHGKPDTRLKRQKLGLPSGVDMHVALADLLNHRTAAEDCRAMLEALETFRQSMESRTSSDRRRASGLALRLHEAVAPALEVAHTAIIKDLSSLVDLKDLKDDCSTPVKEKNFLFTCEISLSRLPTPPHPAIETDSSYASATESASNSSDLDTTKTIVGTNSARSLHSAELSQDEIQKNYREFEEVARRRKTNLATVLSCDVGDIDFERIFLEDSELEGVSGLSDDMDGLLMEDD